jgi:nucleotide-binding universal stress UspA family protein
MKLLLCSDGSEQAERALRTGAAIASSCGAEVTLFGVLDHPGAASPVLEVLQRGQAALEAQKIHAELITKAGEAVEEIRKRTEKTDYDMVVIGAVRKTNRGLFWMSSKAYKILKAIKPPVLLVTKPTPAIKRILLCSGGKRYIEAAVRLTGELARCLGASVNLLHVAPTPPAIYASLVRVEDRAAALLKSESELGINLRRDKEILDELKVPVQVLVRQGAVLEEILSETREGNYDMVVTGSAPGGGFRSYVLGDVTRELVNRAPCAVLVVRSLGYPVPAWGGFGRWFGCAS